MDRTPKIFLIGVGESEDIHFQESDTTNGEVFQPVRPEPVEGWSILDISFE